VIKGLYRPSGTTNPTTTDDATEIASSLSETFALTLIEEEELAEVALGPTPADRENIRFELILNPYKCAFLKCDIY
jgi:hypothetical protein